MIETTRIELAPARAPAGIVMVLTAGALAAIVFSSLGMLLKITFAVLALMIGTHAVVRLLFASLEVRLLDGRFEYRRHSSSDWISLDERAKCFVSPLYIGWRDSHSRAAGIFRGQIGSDMFRRISAVLRQRQGGRGRIGSWARR